VGGVNMGLLDRLNAEVTPTITQSKKEKQPLTQSEKLINFYKEINNKHADSIMKSSNLRIEITKDIKNNVDNTEVLKKAIECIYLMTGDDMFRKLKDKL
jgi:hypothetical protein